MSEGQQKPAQDDPDYKPPEPTYKDVNDIPYEVLEPDESLEEDD